jgi:hypothetical protein
MCWASNTKFYNGSIKILIVKLLRLCFIALATYLKGNRRTCGVWSGTPATFSHFLLPVCTRFQMFALLGALLSLHVELWSTNIYVRE